jgi:hypothetical protein
MHFDTIIEYKKEIERIVSMKLDIILLTPVLPKGLPTNAFWNN